MKYKKKTIKFLFENIKNGDFIGFYHTPWYFLFSKVISLLTGSNIDHVAGVFNVNRTKDRVDFCLGEQTRAKGKAINRYVINKFVDIKKGKTIETYQISSRFINKNIKIYYLPNKYNLTKEQNSKIKEYWEEHVDYSILQLPLSFNFINKFINIFRKNKRETYDRFCSGACKKSMDLIGITPTKTEDNAPSPIEFVKFSYINRIYNISKNKQLHFNNGKSLTFKNIAIVTLFISLIIVYIYPRYNKTNFCKSNTTIQNAMFTKVKQCKQGYYISWIQFGNKSLAQHYEFVDVVSYNNKDNKAYSLKNANINPLYYQKGLKIDIKLFSALLKKPSGEPIFLDKEQIKVISRDYKHIDYILQNINKDIESLAYSLTYNYDSILFKKVITNMFIISKENGVKESCNRKEMSKIVFDLAFLADKILITE